MIKSIYKKVLDILVNSLMDPQDEDNNCYTLNYKEINLIIDTVKKAMKKEKLLELYRYLNENTNDYDLDFEDVDKIHDQIYEIEEELK